VHAISRHHQFVTPLICGRWVRVNDLRWPRSFAKSVATINVRPSDIMSSCIFSIQRRCCLPLFHFPWNLACSTLGGIRSTHSSYVSKPFKSSLKNLSNRVGCLVS